ncbi:MAG: histidine kinase N-terminal 7TM domain-containing protein [Bacillota bacterium]
MANNIFLAIVLVSTVLLTCLAIYVKSVKAKKQMHVFFMYTILFLIVYNIGMAIIVFSDTFFRYKNVRFEYIVFLGVAFCTVFFLLFCIAFVKQRVEYNYKFYLLFLIPLITNIVLWTNDYHKLFYKEYGYGIKFSFGPYFYIGMVFTWAYILAGTGYLLYFTVKNSGFFSKQARFLISGAIIPLPFNVSWIIGNMLEIDYLKFYSPYDISSVTLTVTVIFFAYAIFKFDFLNVVPVALQRIVDIMPDSFVVIDDEYNIIDFNKTLINTFGGFFQFKRKANIVDVIKENTTLNVNADGFTDYIRQAVDTREPISFEHHFASEDFDRYFVIEIIPMFTEIKKRRGIDPEKAEKTEKTEKTGKTAKSERKANLIGIIILLKDITEHKKNIEAIKEHQAILLEQERLASLGQLIGGIAHNLKTPIMSVSGGIEALRELVYEYRDSIGDKSVTDQDHQEIALEMLSWLDKMKPYCTYMSDVISAVKGQAVQMIASGTEKFTINEVVKKVDLLLRHELNRNHCILKINPQIDMSTEIKGEVNNLIQVFDNIIINAMQAYEGKGGVIELRIVRSGDNVEFTFKDYAKGIPKQVTEKLFKEMVTTKGKNGTGLGLYMSYSTIKGRFGGNISFTTKEGCGTTFFISVPCITYNKQEA